MNEPAEEQLDPQTIVRPASVLSGGKQDDSQNPFEPTLATPADDSAQQQTAPLASSNSQQKN